LLKKVPWYQRSSLCLNRSLLVGGGSVVQSYVFNDSGNAVQEPLYIRYANTEEPSCCGARKLGPGSARTKNHTRRVYRYDRFARSLRQFVNALDEFRALGIDFVSVHEGIDTSTPNGRLIFGIFASIAEFERELIRSCAVRPGLGQSQRQAFGASRVSVDLDRIAALRSSGESWALIALMLGVGEGTVRRAAQQPAKNPSATSSVSPCQT
jgi:hypothetical protein